MTSRISTSVSTRTVRPKPAVLPAAALARVITDAAIFACRDTTLPMINVVRLESTANQVMAIATDRFTLGTSVATYGESDGHTFAVDLKLPQAQLLARIAKACKRGDVRISNTKAGVTFAFSTGEKLTLPDSAGDIPFPDWRTIVKEVSAGDSSPAAMIGFNPIYMARFSRIANAGSMVIRVGAASRATFVKIGEEFFGLIMPVRIADGAEWSTPEWVGVPEQQATPAKPKRTPAKRSPAKRKPKTAAKRPAVAS